MIHLGETEHKCDKSQPVRQVTCGNVGLPLWYLSGRKMTFLPQDCKRDIRMPTHCGAKLSLFESLPSPVYVRLPAGAASGELLGDEELDQGRNVGVGADIQDILGWP